jgi:pimeloyl-ACP methyl ester carboxylesterase
METVTHHGRTTAYRLAQPDADGLTALYVHGSGGNHRIWAGQYGADGPTHPAAAIDLSGHGESDDVETEPGRDTLEAYTEDILAVGREIEADVFVGNSLGGAIVLNTLLKHNVNPTAAVLAGSGAKLAVLEELREWLKSDFEQAIEFLHGPDRLFHEPDEAMLEQSDKAMRNAGQAVTRRDYLTCHQFDVRGHLDRIQIPILAVVGQTDGLTPVRYHEYFQDTLPDCELAVIHIAAHLAMVEQTDAFNEVISSFIHDTETP